MRILLSAVALVAVSIMTGGFLLSVSEKCEAQLASTPKIVLAYVQASGKTIPDPSLVSHIIYSFAEFDDANRGVIVADTSRLRSIAALKDSTPELKVILGVGGPKREGFSEMASAADSRQSFVESCKAIVERYNLDGVDLDWEFPTTEKGGHTAAPDDTENYCEVMKLLRSALGPDAWISFYSNNSGKWIDFEGMLPYVTCVNLSGYNLNMAPQHQSALYPSRKCGGWSVSKSVERHRQLGVPNDKILLGVPMFGRGMTPFPSYVECQNFDKYSADCHIVWDDEAKASYYSDSEGNLVLGFDDERAMSEKAKFIKDNGLAGAFYWHYDSDYPGHMLGRCLYDNLIVPNDSTETLR